MKGLLFKPDMIQAIIESRKTQTRRVIKHDPRAWDLEWFNPHTGVASFSSPAIIDGVLEVTDKKIKPRYEVGETVYVKEAGVWDKQTGYCAYKLNMPDVQAKWQSPLFMPEWAARYFITITDVRAERLQEITEEDAKREGVALLGYTTQFGRLLGKDTYRWSFEQLWNSINKDYLWESNPWVFVYTFKQK